MVLFDSAIASWWWWCELDQKKYQGKVFAIGEMTGDDANEAEGMAPVAELTLGTRAVLEDRLLMELLRLKLPPLNEPRPHSAKLAPKMTTTRTKTKLLFDSIFRLT